MSEAECKKEMREALDAALSGARDWTAEALFVDAIYRVLHADEATRVEVTRWLRKRK